MPGDIVMLRGANHAKLHKLYVGDLANNTLLETSITHHSIGVVISTNPPEFSYMTYVVFSNPCRMGWINDGALRKL